MPIYNSRQAGLATDADILVNAFDGALRELQMDRTRPEALVVAEHLITFAKAGERDPVRLCDLAVKAARHNGSGDAVAERPRTRRQYRTAAEKAPFNGLP